MFEVCFMEIQNGTSHVVGLHSMWWWVLLSFTNVLCNYMHMYWCNYSMLSWQGSRREHNKLSNTHVATISFVFVFFFNEKSPCEFQEIHICINDDSCKVRNLHWSITLKTINVYRYRLNNKCMQVSSKQ
jgi:hypothetical protein